MTDVEMKEAEIDEDEVEDKKDFEKEKFEVTQTLDSAKIQEGSKVVILSKGAPVALARIIFEQTWEQIGSIDVKYQEKTKPALIVYSAGGLVWIKVEEHFKPLFCGKIMSGLWPILSDKGCSFVGL